MLFLVHFSPFLVHLVQLILRWFEAVPEGPGAGKDKDKEDQEDLTKVRGDPLGSHGTDHP